MLRRGRPPEHKLLALVLGSRASQSVKLLRRPLLRRRTAPCQERWYPQLRGAIDNRFTVAIDQGPSRCHEDGVAGRHIPVVSWSEPRIMVGGPLGDAAEF